MKRFLSVCSLSMLFPFLTGCFGGPSRIDAPQWDVDKISDACMAQADENSDGFITKKEAQTNAPGLAYSLKQLDTDGDKQLSRDEVRQRFQDLTESKTGVQGFSARLIYKGRPMRQADVRLIPEPFLDGIVEEAEGEISDEYTGAATFDIPGDEFFGVRPGMYRIHVTSADTNIPAKYNDETILGVEVAPFTNPFEEAGGIQIKMK